MRSVIFLLAFILLLLGCTSPPAAVGGTLAANSDWCSPSLLTGAALNNAVSDMSDGQFTNDFLGWATFKGEQYCSWKWVVTNDGITQTIMVYGKDKSNPLYGDSWWVSQHPAEGEVIVHYLGGTTVPVYVEKNGAVLVDSPVGDLTETADWCDPKSVAFTALYQLHGVDAEGNQVLQVHGRVMYEGAEYCHFSYAVSSDGKLYPVNEYAVDSPTSKVDHWTVLSTKEGIVRIHTVKNKTVYTELNGVQTN